VERKPRHESSII